MSQATLSADRLDWLQRETFEYFIYETNPANGLVADKTRPDWPASIAATGLALAAYPVGVERGLIMREEAVERTLVTLRFFQHSPQGTEANATGYKGFYYHFLDLKSGRRAWRCELSTVDTALLLAGILTSAAYFDQESEEEDEIRKLADSLYRRADWQWAQNGGATVTHGWKPESGFLKYRWEGYEVPVPVISQAVMKLISSRDDREYWARAIAMMRHGFGGHPYGPDKDIAQQRQEDRVGGFPKEERQRDSAIETDRNRGGSL